MLKCKNDSTKFYKGDEPSPKGLGYCAHSEEIDKVRKGKDGNMWEIKTTSKGIKRWVKKKLSVKIILKCKNDSTKSYKGDEPSPKGLGYCAHSEEIGKVRKGKDGNMWEIKTTIKGIKRWVKR
jgi:hypothetical protein